MRRSNLLESRFNIDDLLLDDVTRTASPGKCVLLGTFGVGGWVVFYQTITGHFDNTMFFAYLSIFAAPAVTKIIGTAIRDALAASPPTPPTPPAQVTNVGTAASVVQQSGTPPENLR